MRLPIFNFRSDELLEHKKTIVNFQKALKTYKDPTSCPYKYIKAVESKLGDILVGTLDELNVIKDELVILYNFKKEKCIYRAQNKDCGNCQTCNKNKEKTKFSEIIQDAFNYKSSRVAPIFKLINNKACYICNSQYTLFAYKNYLTSKTKLSKLIGTVIKPNGRFIIQEKTVAKFQFDHYYPKSIYPAFSLSIYNLVPICASCNIKKGNREYELGDVRNELTFTVEESSIVDYYKNNGPLKISLEDKTKDKIGRVFDLKGIYDNHTDIIEEVLARKIKYNNNSRDALTKRFGNIVKDGKVIEDRLILGTYAKSEGFEKRPLSKFIHDINDQLDSFLP